MVEDNPENIRCLGTLKGRLKDNIGMEFKEMEWDSMDWTHLAWWGGVVDSQPPTHKL
jgi:hypothetical protein